ncbi:50S ribosomal protein L6 [Spiroplasma turonicum]|uniref:Large ribosomal subunit protein uL6 n=1 Tax=Spiroplasma turonicum TaxID=216946 RepID=A0A0K1P7S9_9MOLU|nr:50S ribosomal protein L6 [Spiroplasma turonicum]AKU80254.1 50S ribosomal protein L6 [Spiroplasma turonicum]ALX71255.1 50S ribosomal protein L6 [Spiroplasma turonicum]
MSRIGNRILPIPNGVEVKVEGNNVVTIKGQKGELKQTFSPLIKIIVEDQQIKTIRENEIKHTKQLHGTTNSILEGMLTGTHTGFVKELSIVGVGYRAALAGNKINLSLGFSHPVEYEIPQGITVEIPKPTEIKIMGINKQLVGQVAADIRAYRKPEPYKGKGVKYKDEKIIRKQGKAAGK